MKPVRFHPAALEELVHEVEYYTAVSKQLGSSLADAIEAAIGRASEFPSMGPPYKYKTRRTFPGKYPFSLVYVEREADVFVLAFAPDSRKPGYWRSRVNAA